jgi:hypothetical protein
LGKIGVLLGLKFWGAGPREQRAALKENIVGCMRVLDQEIFLMIICLVHLIKATQEIFLMIIIIF